MLPTEVLSELRGISLVQSRGYWTIGDRANELTEELKNYHRFQVHSAVGQVVGLSSHRVAKIAAIAATFQARNEALPFGYYERAFDLPPLEQEQALEFIDFYEAEYGRRPGVEEFIALYRTQIMAQPIYDPHRPLQARLGELLEQYIQLSDHSPYAELLLEDIRAKMMARKE